MAAQAPSDPAASDKSVEAGFVHYNPEEKTFEQDIKNAEKKVFTKASAGNTFGDTDSLEEFYKPIDTFEGLHRYDPSFSWDPKDEKKLVRRVSLVPAAVR